MLFTIVSTMLFSIDEATMVIQRLLLKQEKEISIEQACYNRHTKNSEHAVLSTQISPIFQNFQRP